MPGQGQTGWPGAAATVAGRGTNSMGPEPTAPETTEPGVANRHGLGPWLLRAEIPSSSEEVRHLHPAPLPPALQAELRELNTLGAFQEIPGKGAALDDVLQE